MIGRAGAPDGLLTAAAEKRVVVLLSTLLVAELHEVLRREKFRRYFSVAQGESLVV